MKNIYDESEITDAVKDAMKEALKTSTTDDLEVLTKKAYHFFVNSKFAKTKVKITYTKEGELDNYDLVAGAYWFRNSSDPYSSFKRICDYSTLPVKNPFTHIENEKKFVKACKVLFPNVDAYNVGSCLTNFRRVIENIYYNLGDRTAKSQQLAFYQYSTLGGTGKSNFYNHLTSFLTKNKIPNGSARIKGRWIGSEYSRFIAAVDDEFFPYSGRDAENTIINFNNVVDNTRYEVEYKGKDSYFIQSKATLFINSNKLPFDSNIRRYGIVKYNENPIASCSKTDIDKYLTHTQDEIDQAFMDAFNSAPFGKTWKNFDRENTLSNEELIIKARELVETENQMVLDKISCCSIREFAKEVMNNRYGGSINPDAFKKEYWVIKQSIVEAVGRKEITPVKRVNGSVEYSKYNFLDIAKMKSNEDGNDNPLDNYSNMLEATAVSFDAYISKSTEPDPNGGIDFSELDAMLAEPEATIEVNGKEIDLNEALNSNTYDTIEEGQTYESKYDTEATNGDNDEYQVLNPVEGSRKDDNCTSMRNFVFECDNTSLEDQKALLLQNKDIINRAVFSGNKSIHMRITINYNPTSKEEYKWLHSYLNDTLFRGLADTACSNPSRLVRNPGATRRSNNRKQLELFASNTVYPCQELHDKFINEKQNNEMLREMTARRTTKAPKREDTIADTLDKHPSNSEGYRITMELLSDTAQYEEVAKGISYLKWWGFSYEDACKEINWGKWNITKEYWDKIGE